MLLPLRTDAPLRRTPYVNWLLILINVAVYCCQLAFPQVSDNLHLNPRHPALYTFISYAFLHGSVMHIVGNMLFLYIFGNNVNDRLGNIGYLGFYLAGAVVSGTVYLLTSSVPLIGASGAVAAVTGAYLVLFPRSHVTIVYFFFMIGATEIPSMWFIGFFFAWDVLFQISSASSNVAHIAHIGGSLFGFAVCFALLSFSYLPRDHFDIVALVQQWNRRRQYRDVVSSGYNPFDYTRGRAKADPRQERIQDLRAEIAEEIAHRNVPQAAKLYLELRAIDPEQLLSRQTHLDIAHQLYAQEMFAAAADAYEVFVKGYPKYDQIEQIQLMLGILCSRYVGRPDKAKKYLNDALTKLHGEKEVALATEELRKIEASSPVGN